MTDSWWNGFQIRSTLLISHPFMESIEWQIYSERSHCHWVVEWKPVAPQVLDWIYLSVIESRIRNDSNVLKKKKTANVSPSQHVEWSSELHCIILPLRSGYRLSSSMWHVHVITYKTFQRIVSIHLFWLLHCLLSVAILVWKAIYGPPLDLELRTCHKPPTFDRFGDFFKNLYGLIFCIILVFLLSYLIASGPLHGKYSF